MDSSKLKEIVEKAQDAVSNINDDSLKQIAFQKILDSLLTSNQTSSGQVTGAVAEIKQPSALTTQHIPENISEFFGQKNPKTHPDIVLTMAYYFHFKGTREFTVGEIIDTYNKVLIPKPRNPTDIINHNIRKSFIAKADKDKDSKQAYYITKYGLDYVNNSFSGKSKRFSSKRKKGNIDGKSSK